MFIRPQPIGLFGFPNGFWRLPLAESRGAAACEVIGQDDFDGNGENRWTEITADSLCWPYGICMAGGLLTVAGSGNNQVVLWDCHDLDEEEHNNVLGCTGTS